MKAFFRKTVAKAIRLGIIAWIFKFGAMKSDTLATHLNYGQYNQRLEAKYGYQKPVTVGDATDNFFITIEYLFVNSLFLL